MPVQIDVVDEDIHSDNGYLAVVRRLYPSSVHSYDVLSLVLGVLQRAGDDLIARLCVYGHGHCGQQCVGGGIQRHHPDVIQRIGVTPRGFQDAGRLWDIGILGFLCGHFTSDAIVELHGCHVGARWEGQILCWQLSQLWHVRVRAGIAEQYAHRGDRFDGATYVEADGRRDSLEPLAIRRQ